jgi:streptogramin lyase
MALSTRARRWLSQLATPTSRRGRAFQPLLEPLEERCQPAVTITEFSAAGMAPDHITAGPDGNLWFTDDLHASIGRITPQGSVQQFSAGISKGVRFGDIAAGPDGNVWFTEPNLSRVGRIAPSGAVDEFRFASNLQFTPTSITAGSDGNLWMTDSNDYRICQMTPQGKTSFKTTNTNFLVYPSEIVAGPDGNLWFTRTAGGAIGRLTTSGAATDFTVTTIGRTHLNSLVAGRDGNLWYVDYPDRIGRITPAGAMKELPLPPGVLADRLTAGPDGNLWFTEPGSNTIGRLTPQGVETQFSTGISASSGLADITVGPDGNLWFTEALGKRIGRVQGLQAATATQLSATAAAAGQPAILTAVVTTTARWQGLPTGTVMFRDGAVPLGTATLSGGTAVLVTGALSAGTHTYTATYVGSTAFVGSTSAAVSVRIQAAETSINLGTLTPATYGEPITLTAQVAAKSLTEFNGSLPTDAHTEQITRGPDGNFWFIVSAPTEIGQITPQGDMHLYPMFLPAGIVPKDITVGVDGQLWFTEFGTDAIGCVSVGSYLSYGEYHDGITHGAAPYGITPGPDGNLWFTEYSGERIGRITPSGVITEFSAGITRDGTLHYITAGPDGNLWFTETNDRIGRITPSGVVTEFSVGITHGSSPNRIVAGPDGNLWFTEFGRHAIGRITPFGQVTEFAVAGTPMDITAGTDGNLWYTYDGLKGHIACMTPDGQTISDTKLGAHVQGITTGPDGSVWAIEQWSAGVARLVGSAGHTPTGTVTFYDGARALGTAPLSGGSTALTIPPLRVGSHSIRAIYNPTAGFTTSTSPSTALAVTAADTAISLSSSASMATAGDVVSYIAAVSALEGTADPAGYVCLFDGGKLLGSAVVAGGLAVLNTTPTHAGSHSITATFMPSANFQGCKTSDAFVETINAAQATQLVFGQQPSPTYHTDAISPAVTVLVEDVFGNVVDTDVAVHLALAQAPDGAELDGTATQSAVHGIATFPDLHIGKLGVNYRLAATSDGLNQATSDPFDIWSK